MASRRRSRPASGDLVCLAIPALVIERSGSDQALIDAGGVRKHISLALVPDAVPGDFVIVHVGYALAKLDPEEAARTLALFDAAGTPAGAERAA